MAIRSTFTTGEVLTAADLTDTIKGAFINTETTTARTLGTADAGNLVTLNNNSGGTVTIPTNTTWGSPLGTLVHLINIGTAGSFTVGTAAGVTLNAASATLAIQEGGTLIKTATNTWQFVKGGGLGKARYSSTTGSPTVTTVSGKTCVQFTGSGSITISQAGTVEALIVGGGGGSANGGGGSGGLLQDTSIYLQSGTQTVTVGAGGAAQINGTSSRIGLYYGVGGGGVGTSFGAAANGYTGGSGGGSYNAGTAGGATSGQGNAGGGSTSSNNAGGGGGAGGAATAGAGTTGGNGGIGIASSITGTSVTYASGGGGYGSGTAGTASAGGGGNGATASNGTAGTANRGGGGGGGNQGNSGAAGGSGIVILVFG